MATYRHGPNTPNVQQIWIWSEIHDRHYNVLFVLCNERCSERICVVPSLYSPLHKHNCFWEYSTGRGAWIDLTCQLSDNFQRLASYPTTFKGFILLYVTTNTFKFHFFHIPCSLHISRFAWEEIFYIFTGYVKQFNRFQDDYKDAVIRDVSSWSQHIVTSVPVCLTSTFNEFHEANLCVEKLINKKQCIASKYLLNVFLKGLNLYRK